MIALTLETFQDVEPIPIACLTRAAVSPPDVGNGPVMLLIGEALRGALERSSECDTAIARAA